jgi:glyoxalase family protein
MRAAHGGKPGPAVGRAHPMGYCVFMKTSTATSQNLKQPAARAAHAQVTGLHHVTAIASDPQRNIDFYAGLLGLRLVKKTVNFDDPSAYHLYYGDETGSPGSILTFFYWPGGAGRGRVGAGQVTRLSFSVPAGSLPFWENRLQRHGVATGRSHRFDEDVLTFQDPDGIPVELVEVSADVRSGWAEGEVAAAHALRGLHTTEITLRDSAATEKLLADVMGFRRIAREGGRTRHEAGAGGSGAYIDVITAGDASRGLGGVGTVHHIAFRVADDAGERALQAQLAAAGHVVSPVRDRSYFRSIYYREPGGVLFEIATDIPGFAHDEPVATLGTALRLPAEFERFRADIEASLPPLHPARRYD